MAGGPRSRQQATNNIQGRKRGNTSRGEHVGILVRQEDIRHLATGEDEPGSGQQAPEDT